jgi:tetratricopeptide (TPR) repeat protein
VALLLSGLWCAGLANNAGAAPPPRPTAADIARWIKELGDNDFATREKASRKLWAAGEAAEDALRVAAASDDPEVKRRAGDILEKFKWGIYPDTPKEVLNLIIGYQAANNAAEKIKLIEQLLEAGRFGRKALARIAAAEPDAEVRSQVFDRVSRELPDLLAKGELEAVQGLVEAGLHSGAMGPAYYAAFWLLRGKLDDRIGFFTVLAKDRDEERRRKADEVLAFLYRARGDLAAARRAAERAKRDDLVEAMLFEAADWKPLAALPELSNTARPIEKWSFRAAYHRLAGNVKERDEALAEVRKAAEGEPDKEAMAFIAAKAFFLNDRPAEGLELLATSDRPEVGFEILASQLRYAEAMALVEAARKAESKHLDKLERVQARVLYFLGEKDKAQAIFDRHAARIGPGVETEKFADLLDAEYRAGLPGLARDHCARLLATVKPEEEAQRNRTLLAKVFPNQADAAVVWWSLLRRQQADAPHVQTMRKLHDWLQGKAPAKEVKEFLEKLDKPESMVPATETAHVPMALAEVARAAGLEEQARAILEKAATATSLLRLGDLLADKKQWDKAAEQYHRAWEKDHGNPLPLYLSGWALVQSGKKDEGSKLMEQAHWLPLADEKVRYVFIQDLAKRGQAAAVARESDLQRRVSQPESFYVGAALLHAALEATTRKDYLAAAVAQEQSMLRCLKLDIGFVQPGAYVGVPALIHRLRAEGFLAAGKHDAARQEITLAHAGLPGNLDLAIELVPELEKRGLKKDADTLFDQTLSAYEKACKEYPRCGWLHNSAAWLAACCRRKLDDALVHAERAVELAPKSASHLDTLAEVLFQRGDKDKAVAMQKKVIELDPKKPYYRKQLRRIEAGDPKAPRPAEDDDE